MNTQVASQQPPTTAKVIFYTSHGEIDMQLWTRQTPLASRNFIQHCLEGYYLNTTFHRLISGFMIQGGDPTGTGMGGESIYDGPFKDQFHQRLKFTKRGVIAMANAGKNTNKSQFFITFGACEHLNKKHTIFGKVVGDTIYNLMAMQSLDTGQQDRPLDPPTIRRIKVVQNPFSDIKVEQKAPQQNKTAQMVSQPVKARILNQVKQRKQDLKRLKNKNKLTFQDQDQQQGQALNQRSTRIVSSHDVLYKKDAYISNKISVTKEQLQRKRKEKQLEQRKAEELKNALHKKQQPNENQEDEANLNVNQLISRQMNKKRVTFQKENAGIQGEDQILNYERRFNPTTKKHQIIFKDQLDRQKAEQHKQQQLQIKAREQQQISDQKLRQVRQLQLQQYNLLKADQLNFKRAKEGSLKERRKELIHEEKKLLTNLEKHRYEYMQKQKVQTHQGELFKKLMNFSKRLKGEVKMQATQGLEGGYGGERFNSKTQGKPSWMNHHLKFHIDSSNAYGLEQKAGMRSNMLTQNNKFQQDDGGLKMEVQYNHQSEDDSEKDIEKVLNDL